MTALEQLRAVAGEHDGELALELPDEQLSYGELFTRANAVAEIIRDATEARRLAFVADRTSTAFVTYLGILLGGRTVVPLSPSWPSTRITSVLGLSGAELVPERPEVATVRKTTSGQQADEVG